MKKYKRSLIALLITLVVFFALFMSIVIKSGAILDFKVLLSYLIIGLALGLYSYLLDFLRIKYAQIILLFISIILSFYLYIAMPTVSEGFIQLGILLTWLVLMASTVLILLIYMLIVLVVRILKK